MYGAIDFMYQFRPAIYKHFVSFALSLSLSNVTPESFESKLETSCPFITNTSICVS